MQTKETGSGKQKPKRRRKQGKGRRKEAKRVGHCSTALCRGQDVGENEARKLATMTSPQLTEPQCISRHWVTNIRWTANSSLWSTSDPGSSTSAMGHKRDTQHTVPLCAHLKRGMLGGQRHSGQKVFLQGIDGRWACHALHSAQGPGTVPALALHIGIQQGRCLAPASLLGTEQTGKTWYCMLHVTGPGRWGCCPQ